MKLLLLFFIIILVPLAIADQVDNYNTNSYLDTRFILSSNISLTYGENSKLQNLRTNLSLVPSENYMQNIDSLDVNSQPNANIVKNKDSIVLEWSTLNDFYQYDIDSRIRTLNVINKIPHIDFPINSLDQDYEKYLEPEIIIDTNQEIMDQANSLVNGETDQFEAVFKIADWVKTNIRYDLNTLTASASQKSSWVLANKEGVCDEMTSLFISMLRSVGIPSRFITGMVYSNVNYDFGNHGWAEVYFPGYGWVPFDVTFGEYGWINPGHIRLSDDLDAGEPSVKYSWKAFNVEVNPAELSLQSTVLSTGPKIDPIYKIELETLFDKVGPNSYVPLKVSVKNPFNYYVSTTITITKAPEIIELNSRQIILRPNEEKSFFWTIKTPGFLEKNFVYTAQLDAEETFGSSASSTLEYSLDYNVVSFNEAKSKIEELEVQNKDSYSKDISLKCESLKQYYYINDSAEIKCNIINTGNSEINFLKVCIEENCKDLNLAVSEQKILNFNFKIENSDKKTFVVNANNDKININNFVTLNIFDKNPLRISSINIPSKIGYYDEFIITFVLSAPVNIKDLEIRVNDLIPTPIAELDESKEVNIPLKGIYFLNKNLKLSISYKDINNKDYILEKEIPIKLENVPWYAEIIAFFYNVFK